MKTIQNKELKILIGTVQYHRDKIYLDSGIYWLDDIMTKQSIKLLSTTEGTMF
jgi:hypothetical protein